VFSPPIHTWETTDQKCEFRMAEAICEIDIRKFLDSPNWIHVDNTVGAYYCKPSDPHEVDLCQDILNRLDAYSISGVALSCACGVCFIFASIGICLQDDLNRYNTLIGCCVKCGCTCCEQLRPLLSRDSSGQIHLNY
jgi:hypothetical protein